MDELLSEVPADVTRLLSPPSWKGTAHRAYLIAMSLFLWVRLRSLSSLSQDDSWHVHCWLNPSFQELLVCFVPGSASHD